MFLEVSCPADINVVGKETEKIRKYQALAREMNHCYDPVVFGHSGVVSKHQRQYLKVIPHFTDSVFNNLQKAALLGTIAIMRYVNFLVYLRYFYWLYSVCLYMCISFFHEKK